MLKLKVSLFSRFTITISSLWIFCFGQIAFATEKCPDADGVYAEGSGSHSVISDLNATNKIYYIGEGYRYYWIIPTPSKTKVNIPRTLNNLISSNYALNNTSRYYCHRYTSNCHMTSISNSSFNSDPFTGSNMTHLVPDKSGKLSEVVLGTKDGWTEMSYTYYSKSFPSCKSKTITSFALRKIYSLDYNEYKNEGVLPYLMFTKEVLPIEVRIRQKGPSL